jgi:transcriptional regulator GlxA family with amidase domain
LPDHLAEDLGVELLARKAGMSPRTFARRFQRETGTTPAAFVEQLRVEQAKRLLASSDLTVDAVAARVGLRGRRSCIGRLPAGSAPPRAAIATISAGGVHEQR